MFELGSLRVPIVQAPMAGGPSTPELAAAVSNAGGLGFLAAGYRSADNVRADVLRTRELTSRPFGVNLFLLAESPVDTERLAAYADKLAVEEQRRGVAAGEARFDDDEFAAKLALATELQVPVMSFTFGCPSTGQIMALHDHGIAVWVTVTDPDEGEQADRAGADALIAQGVEAGGHRGSFADTDGHGELSLLPLLRLLASVTDLPLIASGGIADGPGVAAALAAGARAVQIGTGFMRAREAATAPAHREALAQPRPTAVTRAFTGRRARGIVNAFMRDHGDAAPSAYPHVHHLTAPLRAAARQAGDAEGVNLWAGEAHVLAQERPAAELVRRWDQEARAALEQAKARLGGLMRSRAWWIILACALVWVLPPAAAAARVVLVGRSVHGRTITARVVGPDAAKRRILVVGCIHGNECAGLRIVHALAHRRPAPGVQLWLIGELNPDGTAAGTRQNADGVDLNRNFPYHWQPVGDPTYYSGPHPASEPETRAAIKLIRHIRPVVTIWYHQHQDLVDMSGGDRGVARRYAQLAHLRATCLPFLPGTATGWENHEFPRTTSFVVELPAGPVGDAGLRHHLAAVRAMETGQRTGSPRSCAP